MQPVRRNQSFNRLFMPGRNRWPWVLAGSPWLTIRHVTPTEATNSTPDLKQEARCELLSPPTLLAQSAHKVTSCFGDTSINLYCMTCLCFPDSPSTGLHSEWLYDHSSSEWTSCWPSNSTNFIQNHTLRFSHRPDSEVYPSALCIDVPVWWPPNMQTFFALKQKTLCVPQGSIIGPIQN